jgi:hypothetical protein
MHAQGRSLAAPAARPCQHCGQRSSDHLRLPEGRVCLGAQLAGGVATYTVYTPVPHGGTTRREHSPSTEQIAAAREALAQWEARVRRMPPRNQAIVWGYVVEGDTAVVVGARHGVTDTQVSKIVHAIPQRPTRPRPGATRSTS